MKNALIFAVCSSLFIGCNNSAKQAELKRLEEQQMELEFQQEQARERKRREIARAERAEKQQEEFAEQERQAEIRREQLEAQEDAVRRKQIDDKFKADLDEVGRGSKEFGQKLDGFEKQLRGLPR